MRFVFVCALSSRYFSTPEDLSAPRCPSGGETISPFEIEEAVAQHPSVKETLAFSAPHAQYQESVRGEGNTLVARRVLQCVIVLDSYLLLVFRLPINSSR